MKAGDTFFLHGKAADRHLWVILSDPDIEPDHVLFVSMTSHDVTKESVCLIDAGEHPFVVHATCMAYDMIKVARLDQLRNLEAKGLLKPYQPVSTLLLERIRMGASLSRRISEENLEILIRQGLLG